jgi:hypothetical protein
VIDHASAKVSDANATKTHARNSQTLAELEHQVATSIVAQYVGGWFTSLRLSDMFKASLSGIWLAIICGSVSFLVTVVCHYFEIHGITALVVALVPAGLVYLKLEAANLMQMARQTAPPQPASSGSAETEMFCAALRRWTSSSNTHVARKYLIEQIHKTGRDFRHNLSLLGDIPW